MVRDTGSKFKELVDLMEYMRGPKGCAWDKEQTIEDFSKHLKNESDEVLEAISRKDYPNLREELGDLLWNIVFISQIALEEGFFTIEDVINDVNEKIVRRHPHVFGGERISDPDEIIRRWHEIKRDEKK